MTRSVLLVLDDVTSKKLDELRAFHLRSARSQAMLLLVEAIAAAHAELPHLQAERAQRLRQALEGE